MNTLNDVKATVRSLVGDDDPNGWLQDSYLVPKINYAYRRMYLYLKRGTGMNLEKMVEIPDAVDGSGNSITQGLGTLAAFQQTGKFLDGLYEPLYMWWKRAGSNDRSYCEYVERKTIMPGKTIGGIATTATFYGGNAGFTWRGNQIFMTPLSFPIDILVDGRFNPPALVKDEDVLVADPDMETCVTPATMALIGIESGNSSFQSMKSDAETAADDIVAKIVRSKQGFTARSGSNARRGAGCGWSWW